MTVVIAVPWRPTLVRLQLRNYFDRYYEQWAKDIPRIYVDDPDESRSFNRSAARNAAVQAAKELGASVVALLDADCLVHPYALQRAVEEASVGHFAKPMTKALTLDPEAGYRRARMFSFPRNGGWQSPGLAYVMKPSVWEFLEGQDENFTSWGGEDTSIHAVADAFGLTTVWDPEHTCIQLHHSERRWANDPQWMETIAREAVYHELRRDAENMRIFLDQRDEEGVVEAWVERLGLRQRIEDRWRRDNATRVPEVLEDV